jgi:hypothetical protein
VFTETGKKPGKDGNGLVAGHAYSLIAAKESSKGDKLVKLRSAYRSITHACNTIPSSWAYIVCAYTVLTMLITSLYIEYYVGIHGERLSGPETGRTTPRCGPSRCSKRSSGW